MSRLKKKTKICIVACSVLKDEIKKLVKAGELNADLRFVSKYFHVDYAQIEKNLRPMIERALKSHPENVILVYGDLCLGMDNEMKRLVEEYGIVKVDALNCIDCQLGGKGVFLEADPHHDLMFLSPGMLDFFAHMKEMMRKEGVSEDVFKQFFSGVRGIVILDTLGNVAELKLKVEKLDTGLLILDTKTVGCGNVKKVIDEAIDRNQSRIGGKEDKR
ncbi:MAG: DUF1638 domain-containing protein [Candidatus Bathyarchaeota archaeon]|nr:DUF1638 domain-containing protein [Candidatus Bathyarchaeota archaeon]